MRIAEFLREDLVFADLKANEKAAVLGEMSAALARSFPSLAAGRLTEALLEREKLGSTGVGEGVAIPHGTVMFQRTVQLYSSSKRSLKSW